MVIYEAVGLRGRCGALTSSRIGDAGLGESATVTAGFVARWSAKAKTGKFAIVFLSRLRRGSTGCSQGSRFSSGALLSVESFGLEVRSRAGATELLARRCCTACAKAHEVALLEPNCGHGKALCPVLEVSCQLDSFICCTRGLLFAFHQLSLYSPHSYHLLIACSFDLLQACLALAWLEIRGA